jgi:hypothetical protein
MPKKLPSRRYLDECFAYNPRTGALSWKQRPPRHFSSVVQHRSVNTRWAGKPAGKIADNGSGSAYVFVRVGSYGVFLAHRIVWKLIYGVEPPELVDHRDGDGLNNRKRNLREGSVSSNSCNSKVRADNTSSVKGVSFSKAANKWQAYVNLHGKRYYLGVHELMADAEKAVAIKRQQLHGEFTRHS